MGDSSKTHSVTILRDIKRVDTHSLDIVIKRKKSSLKNVPPPPPPDFVDQNLYFLNILTICSDTLPHLESANYL